MQQIKAAQNRVEKLEQLIEAPKPSNDNNVQQQAQEPQQQTANNFNALNYAAAMNIYNHKELSTDQQQGALQSLKLQESKDKNPNIITELEKTKTNLQTKEKLLAETQTMPEAGNPEAKKLKEDALFEKLPPELKARKDIGELMGQVDSEALLDPDKAVDALVNEALTGNKKAFMKLDEYSKNPFQKLQQSAAQGMEKVAAESQYSPKVLEMIAGTTSEKSNEAAVKLLNLVDKNPRAQQGFERLVKSGAINFTQVASDAKDKDPAQAASSINMLLLRGTLDKSDRKGAVGILGQIAKESPTGAGSKEAAKGLTRAVMTEPLDIAAQAISELTEATINGNADALSGLQLIAQSNNPSRSQLGLQQLGKVSMSGATGSTESLETIKKVAQSPSTDGKTRNFAVETLGKVANAGGNTGKEAVQTISNVAVNKTNPASGNAFNEIGKLNNSTIGINPTNNNNKQPNLSDSDTYKKVMATQQQINSFGQQSPSLLNKFSMQVA